MKAPQGISLGDLARRIGRDKGALSRAAKEGRIPRNNDGTYDEMAVRAAIEKAFNPARDKPLLPVADVADVAEDDDPVTTEEQAVAAVTLVRRVLEEEGRKVGEGGVTFDDARTAETILKAREKAQSIAKEAGELLPCDEVIRHVASAFSNYKKALQELPSRVGAQMAAELDCDVGDLDRALTRVIHEHLSSLAAPVVRTGGGL